MSIRAKISGVRTISTSVSGTDRIRIASPAFAISPSLSLEDFTDITTVGAQDEDLLIYDGSSNQFLPSESIATFELVSVTGGTF
jgi:hypothetical protein